MSFYTIVKYAAIIMTMVFGISIVIMNFIDKQDSFHKFTSVLLCIICLLMAHTVCLYM